MAAPRSRPSPGDAKLRRRLKWHKSTYSLLLGHCQGFAGLQQLSSRSQWCRGSPAGASRSQNTYTFLVSGPSCSVSILWHGTAVTFKPGFIAKCARSHEKERENKGEINWLRCSRAEVGSIKTGPNNVFQYMLLGTALVRIEETSVSAKPIWNLPAPPLGLHIHYRAELVRAQPGSPGLSGNPTWYTYTSHDSCCHACESWIINI